MNKLEIVHLRLAGGCPLSLIEEVRRSTAAADPLLSVRIYRHASVASDLGVHLHLQGNEGDARPSDLGVRLAEALREHGIVEHTVWIEEQSEERGASLPDRRGPGGRRGS